MAWSYGDAFGPWQEAFEPDGFHSGLVRAEYVGLWIIPHKDTFRGHHTQSFRGELENPLVGLSQLLLSGNQGFIHAVKQTKLDQLGPLRFPITVGDDAKFVTSRSKLRS